MSKRTKYRVRIITPSNPRYASADAAVKAAVPALAALIRSQQAAAPVAKEKAA